MSRHDPSAQSTVPSRLNNAVCARRTPNGEPRAPARHRRLGPGLPIANVEGLETKLISTVLTGRQRIGIPDRNTVVGSQLYTPQPIGPLGHLMKQRMFVCSATRHSETPSNACAVQEKPLNCVPLLAQKAGCSSPLSQATSHLHLSPLEGAKELRQRKDQVAWGSEGANECGCGRM